MTEHVALHQMKLTQINIVVRDIATTRARWSPLIGEPLAEYDMPGPDQVPTTLDGQSVDCSDVRALKYVFGPIDVEALKVGKPLADGVFFLAFWQPGENDTPWRRHLDAHGEGVMDLEFDARELESVTELLSRNAYHVGTFPASSYNLFAARDVLGVDLNLTVRNTRLDLGRFRQS